MGALPAGGGLAWQTYFGELRSAGRATRVETAQGPPLLVATERWPLVQAVWPGARAWPEVNVPASIRRDWPREEAVAFLVRGRMEWAGPGTAPKLGQDLDL